MVHRDRNLVVALVLLTAMTLGCTVIDEARREWFGTRTQTERNAETEDAAWQQGSTVMEYQGEATRPAGEPVLMWKAGNDGAIEGGGGKPPKVTQDKTYFVTEICTYHWNKGTGAPAGEITLKAADGTVYGPWKTTLRNAVYWIAQPNQDIPAGTYTLIDSDPSTWAQNSGSGGTGMGWAYGLPTE
ncbi:MAG: hypothetical protein Q7W16_07775 [Coriobacteriia bacterium]|nr:hypothetical protein [Coriobacteriia bacterium]